MDNNSPIEWTDEELQQALAQRVRDSLSKVEDSLFLMTAAAGSASLTLDSLMRPWDRFRIVVYVHPGDLLNPLLELFRKNRYEIESRATMPAGIACWKDFETWGVVYFERGTFLYYENPERAWEKGYE